MKKSTTGGESQPEQSERTFETALQRLEQIIDQLESANAPLDQAIALVQEGDELSRFCELQLRKAEGKILQLVERLGEVELEPVEGDAARRGETQ